MVLKDKKVLVVGLARSGAGAARLLSLMGAEVTVTDRRPESELIDLVSGLGPSVRLALGGHPEGVFRAAELIVVSPGVSLEIGQIVSARQRGIPVIGELELAFQVMEQAEHRGQRAKGENPIPFLAITGSNGKSTTTTLLDHLMRKAGFNTMLGGNIGNALTEEIFKAMKREDVNVKGNDALSPFAFSLSLDYVVAEVSSFQLEAVERFRPRIASILNITPDHLDRYHSMTDYRDAKANIYLNQRSGDFLVLNADDPGVIDLYERDFSPGTPGRPEVFYFSRTREIAGVYHKEGKIFCNIPEISCREYLIKADEIRIKGVHNLENAMAASAMALLAGCPPGTVAAGMKEFEGLEHRLELVRELDGVTYINDSKGTNVGAVVKSIESFREPLILIAGGRDKAGDFSVLRGPVSQRVKKLFLIGEAAGKMQEVLGEVTETVMAKDLAEAVALARGMAKKGDVVLLSPACASFDMFRDYEDRGRQFKKFVMEMKDGNV